MSDSRLRKHLEALSAETTGNSNDAVTFAGRGLQVLQSLFKNKRKGAAVSSASSSPSSSTSSTSSSSSELKKDYVGSHGSSLDSYTDSSSSVERRAQTKKKIKKNIASGSTVDRANGGYVETTSSEVEDPAGVKARGHAQIANHGERVKGSRALKDQYGGVPFDRKHLKKSLDRIEQDNSDVFDASPAIASLSHEMRRLVKSIGAGMEELQDQNFVLGKALEKSLKSQASMAVELDGIKKSPGTSPSSGFVILNKNSKGSTHTRVLQKTEIEQSLINAIDGATDTVLQKSLGESLKNLGSAKTQEDIAFVVDTLPAAVRDQL